MLFASELREKIPKNSRSCRVTGGECVDKMCFPWPNEPANRWRWECDNKCGRNGSFLSSSDLRTLYSVVWTDEDGREQYRSFT